MGDLFREASIAKTGSDITGFYQREITEDLSIDQMQKELLSDPNPELVFILESRLGGVFAKRLKEENKLPPTITILITTNSDTRYKRVFDRDNPNLSFEEYCKATKDREEKDLVQWQEAHPFLTSNPLDPTSVSLYNLHLDNTNLGIEETVEQVNKKLLELGAVEES